MWQAFRAGWEAALGLGVEAKDLSSLHTTCRALVVFVVGVALIRLGNKRFLGKSTPFDVLLSVMLGTVLARTINGSGPFLPTLVAGAVLVGLHRLLSAAAFHSKRVDDWTKGHRRVLVEKGAVREDELARTHVTRTDLAEAVRLKANGASLEDVESACLERSGEISVRKHPSPPQASAPRVVEVRVEDGVQVVRLKLEP